MQKIFDIIVVGGGHAGVEASYASSQFSNLTVGLVTKPGVLIGSAPCNPAIGGVGKGQLVREIDILGGAMGIIADQSAIQCRKLNESKGYAVQSTRFQIDKNIYPQNARKLLETRSNLTIIEGNVLSVGISDGIFKVKTDIGYFQAKSIVLTVGTFLSGKIHRGEVVTPGGRDGLSPSVSMENLFENVKCLDKLFKTGTPPRLFYNSVNFEKMEEQPSDDSVENFHVLHGTSRFLKQVSCFKTKTRKDSIDIILQNKDKSPMFNGQIKGVGPRYCPSIEDKAFRYPDRHEHHVFVEPESLDLSTVYPNGISTSLPTDVQSQILKTIDGFENAEVERFGYAVEYQVVDTSMLSSSLEYIEIPGLFFAGQVNGTSGYEEAAGQGLVAGLNAARKLMGKSEIIFPRGTSYLGVLIDDVVGVNRDEPYRLFTARAENRLYLREDNCVERLGDIRLGFGLNSSIDDYIKNYKYEMQLLGDIIELNKSSEKILDGKNIKESLKDGKIDPVIVFENYLKVKGLNFSKRAIKAKAIEVKYDGYLKKNEIKEKGLENLSSKKIDWKFLSENISISNECRQRISSSKPKTFFQLKSIPGIRPATVAYVANGVL